jgi:hypothetical protein
MNAKIFADWRIMFELDYQLMKSNNKQMVI